MKIIRQGVVQKDKPIQASCNHCAAVIEFAPSEAQRIPDVREGDFYLIKCPCCNANITKAIPPAHR